MAAVHRMGDPNTGGGVINSIPQGTVYANNKLIAVNGSRGSGHALCKDNNIHCSGNWATTGGGPTVFAENIEINNSGDPDTCGHSRATGSPDVFTDAFQGGGAMFDNNTPYVGSPPPGAQPSPPAGYENNTTATIYVFENDEESHTGNGPPSGVNYSPMETVDSQDHAPLGHPPPLHVCQIEIEEDFPPYNTITVDFDDLPNTFTWATGSPLPTFEDWAKTVYISTNFTIWDMCNGAVGQHFFLETAIQNSGLTQKDILINMCHHANSVLEPMLAAYGPFTITSGFRNKSDSSQHNKGQATDIQFTNFHITSGTYTKENKDAVRLAYYQRAQNVRDNIDFDQLILEYFGTNPWLHVSSNPANHRDLVLTQTSPSPSFSPGLILLG
jgi:hypothetical protein